MRRIKALRIALGVIGGLGLGFWLGRLSSMRQTPLRNPQDVEVQHEFDRFEVLAAAVGEFLAKGGGRIPPDLYRTLVEEGIVSSYRDFLFSGHVVLFDVLQLPCQINTDLGKNVRAPLFWIIRPDIDEVWACYLDGSCEREPGCSDHEGGRVTNFGKAQLSWAREFHGAGYPYWTSPEEKMQWYRENGDRLRWDAGKGFYVPQQETP